MRKIDSVTIGIATYRGESMVERCIQSIYKSRYAKAFNIEIIVVADGGLERDIDRSKMIEKPNEFWVRIHELNEQRGNVYCYNEIIDKATYDCIVLLDSDVLISDRWIWSMAYFLGNNRCGVASYKSTHVGDSICAQLLSQTHIPNVGTPRMPERATELAAQTYAFLKSTIGDIRFDAANFKYFLGDSDFCCQLAYKRDLPSYRILYPEVYHIEHYTYTAYPELKAYERQKVDIANFVQKWGKTADQMETELLAKIPKQPITWLTQYGMREGFDVEEGFGGVQDAKFFESENVGIDPSFKTEKE